MTVPEIVCIMSGMPTHKTAAFHTFGCKVNQYDTQAIREGILRAGYLEATDGAGAALHVINTCTVTAEGDRKARQLVRRIAREDPEARIVVTGCSAERDGEAFRLLPGVTLVSGTRQKHRIAEILGAPPAPFRISRLDGHTRAFLKVQDGCDDRCTYCIVPAVRGEVRSRPPAEVREEAIRLAEAGHREIVLSGIHLGHYGRGEGFDLPALLRGLSDVPIDRIRLSSIEAVEVTDALLEASLASGKVCPHFHLPLQSANDAILRRMGRPYRRADFAARVARIRQAIDDPAITTDVIVGFPGEDESAFSDTLAFCRDIGFSRIHVFPYSEREGTAATRLDGKVPAAVRRRRGREVAEVAADLSRAFAARQVGRRVDLLTESCEDGILRGKTERYLPAWTPGGLQDRNRVVRGRCIRVGDDGLEVRGEG